MLMWQPTVRKGFCIGLPFIIKWISDDFPTPGMGVKDFDSVSNWW